MFIWRMCIWVRSRNCGCLVTWFCYHLIAKPDNKTTAVPWPDPYQNVIFGDHFVQTSMCQNRTYCITWELVHSIMTLLGSNSNSSLLPWYCVVGHLWCLCINAMQLSPNEQVPIQSSLSWQPQLHPLLLLVSLLGTTEIHKPGKMELTTRRNSSEYTINRLHQWWS